MENVEVYAGWQEVLKDIFGSVDNSVFWVENGNCLCKAIRIYQAHTGLRLPFYKNYFVIVFSEGKYRFEIRSDIGECAHATDIILKEEWCTNFKVLKDEYCCIIIYQNQNGRYGAVDLKGNIMIPFDYDAIFPLKGIYVFEVHEDNMIKIYETWSKVEYPSKVIYDTFKFLDDPQNKCNLDAIQRFIKCELGENVVFKTDYDFTKWLSRQYDIRRIEKIDKFLRRLMKKGQYGVNNSYTYQENLLTYLFSVDVAGPMFEKVFAECGKVVEFEEEIQLVEFIMDEANMKFFVKNYKKICEIIGISV